MARYEFAAPHLGGAVALEIACGTGYGLRTLQSKARFLVAADVDSGAARTALEAMDRRRGGVLLADGTRLPFEDRRFGVVVSFETLEHLGERRAFLREIARCLRDDGLFLVSTPNARYTLPIDGKPRNPFHVHEYTPEELRDELGAVFGEVDLRGQLLDNRYVVPPFQWDQRDLRDPILRAGVLARRVLHRLPDATRDQLSDALWGHPFFPRAADYRFDSFGVAAAPVLVALCRGPRRDP